MRRIEKFLFLLDGDALVWGCAAVWAPFPRAKDALQAHTAYGRDIVHVIQQGGISHQSPVSRTFAPLPTDRLTTDDHNLALALPTQ